jgi:predicted PurR-regulated permease PerM
MTSPQAQTTVQQGFLLLLVVVASLAFAWLAGPFIGAILWGVIAAILFGPFNAWLVRVLRQRRGLSALATLLVIVAVVIIPAMLLSAALISEATAVYARFQSGEIDPVRIFVATENHLPDFIRRWLAEIGIIDFDALKATVGRGIASSFEAVAGRAFNIGQSAFAFFFSLGVMLYLAFFLLRDGDAIRAQIEHCLPLPVAQRRLLVSRFVDVVRATVKGSVVVALLQGLIGGLVFWSLGIGGALLWGVAMGIFSLFPAIGTAFIWVPVTAYLLATGNVWQAVGLFLCGFFIISSVDNIVRPILVGRDARMPDYVVLIATLGGFALMGFNGFVIGPVIAALFLTVWEIFADVPGQAPDVGHCEASVAKHALPNR